MKGKTKLILFILTATVALLPLLQQHLKVFRFTPLRGVTEEPQKPAINLANFRNQKIQQWSTAYLKLHYGFREPLTRWYNQYLWDCYDMSNLKKNDWIYVSDDGWYYEAPSMEEYYRGKALHYSKDSLDMAEKLGEEALRLYQLQTLLEPYGTHLFVLLLPGKELIYPEHIPETSNYPGEKKISAWEFYGKRFKELGVNHIDIGQWFLDIKDSIDYPLYPQTGTHWSNYAVLHVTDSLLRYMEVLGDKKLEHYTIGPRYEKTVFPDDDLEQVMNLIRPLPKAPNYAAETTVERDSTADKPVIITIGDSYYWNIINATPFGSIMGGYPYWYYYHTVYFDSLHNNVKDLDVMQEVVDADYVMLAFSTPQIYEMSKGFSQQLLIDLCCDQDDLDTAAAACIKQIHRSPNWMSALEKNVETYGIPLDTVIKEEALNCLRKRPNLFIPVLKDTIPQKLSQKALRLLEEHKSNPNTNDHGIQQ